MSNATLTTESMAAAAPSIPITAPAEPVPVSGLELLRERIALYRGTVAAVLVWLAITLFVVATLGFFPHESRLLMEVNARVGWSVLWSLVGIGLIGIALRLHPRSPAITSWLAQPIPVLKVDVANGVLMLGLLLVAIATIVSTGLGTLEWPQQVGPVAQFILWQIGLLLCGIALTGAGRWRLPRPQWGRVVVVAAIVLLALVLRSGGLGYYIDQPMDEVHYTSGLWLFFYSSQQIDLFTTQSTFLPATMLYSFLNAATVEVFGWNWTGLRMLSALMGTLTVLAVYGLGAALFGHRVGVIAALIAATFPPFLHFGRVAMPHSGDALSGTLLLMFMARALRWNRPADWVLAGLSLGLTQYFFEGGRYSFPVLTVSFFVWTAFAAGVLALIRRFRPTTAPFGRFRPYLQGWGLLLIMFVITAAPMYAAMLATGAPFGSRIAASGIDREWLIDGLFNRLPGDGQMWFVQHITNPFLIYTFNPDYPGMWYSSYTPMVLYPFIPLFLLGIGYAVWRGRTAAFMCVPLLLLASAGSILLSDTLWYVRYVLVMPTVALLIGLGIALTPPLLWGRLAPSVWRRLRRLVPVVTVAAALIVAVLQVGYYFGPFMHEFHHPIDQSMRFRNGSAAVQRFIPLDPDSNRQLYIIDPSDPDLHVPRQIHDFLTGGVPRERPLEVFDSPLPENFFTDLPRDRTYVFAVAPTDTATIAQMRAAFTVEGPYYSTSAHIPPDHLLILFVAPHVDNLPDAAPVAAN